MSIDEFDFDFDDEKYKKKKNGEPTRENIIEKIQKYLNNDLINISVTVSFSGSSYMPNPEFKKIKTSIDNSLSLSKDKSNDNYELEIVSKGDYFIIYIERSMIKIDKSDIIKLGIMKDKSGYGVLTFELKNKDKKIELMLKSNQIYEYHSSIRVDVLYSFKEDKILEFLFSELYEYIERKTNSTYL